MTIDDPTGYIRRAMPFCETLRVTAHELTADRVTLSLDWAAGLCTAAGVLHGGVIMSLADSAGAACAFLNLPDGADATATIESKTNFFAAVASGTVTAVASPLHVGSSTIVIETEVRNGQRLVAKATQTQAVIRRT